MMATVAAMMLAAPLEAEDERGWFHVPAAAEEPARVTLVSSNPFDIILAGAMARDLTAPCDDLEQLVERFAPFQRLGRKSCDQPRGSKVGPGEL